MPTQPTDKMATELLHVQEELAAKNVDADAPKKQAQRASHRLNFLEAMMETVPVGVVMARLSTATATSKRWCAILCCIRTT